MKIVIICPKCEGEGTIAKHGWYDEPCWIQKKCKVCKGTGRLVRTIVDVPFEPLDKNDCSR